VAADPAAKWLMQAWLFFSDQAFWGQVGGGTLLAGCRPPLLPLLRQSCPSICARLSGKPALNAKEPRHEGTSSSRSSNSALLAAALVVLAAHCPDSLSLRHVARNAWVASPLW
jgi:hypothetical protein